MGAGNRVCARVSSYPHLKQRLQRNIENQTDIADLVACEIFQNGDKVEELVVMGVREPAADGNGMLWVENVRRG